MNKARLRNLNRKFILMLDRRYRRMDKNKKGNFYQLNALCRRLENNKNNDQN